jgi:hypothetical protein
MLAGSIQLRCELGRRASRPDDPDVGLAPLAMHGHYDLFDETAKKLFAFSVSRGVSVPDRAQVRTGGAQPRDLLRRQGHGATDLEASEITFAFSDNCQAGLPLALKSPGHQPVLWFDLIELTPGPLSLIARLLDHEQALPAVNLPGLLALAKCNDGGFNAGWLERGQESIHHSLVETDAAQ